MEDTLLKVLNIPIATSGNPLGEYTHINNIIGPAIGVGGTIDNLVTLKSTNFHHQRENTVLREEGRGRRREDGSGAHNWGEVALLVRGGVGSVASTHLTLLTR